MKDRVLEIANEKRLAANIKLSIELSNTLHRTHR